MIKRFIIEYHRNVHIRLMIFILQIVLVFVPSYILIQYTSIVVYISGILSYFSIRFLIINYINNIILKIRRDYFLKIKNCDQVICLYDDDELTKGDVYNVYDSGLDFYFVLIKNEDVISGYDDRCIYVEEKHKGLFKLLTLKEYRNIKLKKLKWK